MQYDPRDPRYAAQLLQQYMAEADAEQKNYITTRFATMTRTPSPSIRTRESETAALHEFYEAVAHNAAHLIPQH